MRRPQYIGPGSIRLLRTEQGPQNSLRDATLRNLHNRRIHNVAAPAPIMVPSGQTMRQQWILTMTVDFTGKPDEVNRELAKVSNVIKLAARSGIAYNVKTREIATKSPDAGNNS